MAAMLVGLERLLGSAQPRPVTILFTATVNEEFGFSGARAIASLWSGAGVVSPGDGPARDLVGAARPVAGIVAEPTSLDVVGMHKGAVRWRSRLDGAARAAPTVAEGKLFVPILGDRLVALAVADGKRVWSYQATEAQTSVLGLPSPAYADGLVVAGFGSGDLVALRAATGAVVWADSLASARGRNAIADLSAIRGMPVIQDGRVYAVGLGGLMLALDLRSGRRLWERDVAGTETPCVAGNWIYLLSTENKIAALHRLDGSVAWVTQLEKFEDPEKQRGLIRWMGPTLAADRLVVASSNALALAVSPYTGAVLGQQGLSGPVSVPPVVALSTVFVVTDDGRLLALR
jgi:outer membrane protein assembly factor BamB